MDQQVCAFCEKVQPLPAKPHTLYWCSQKCVKAWRKQRRKQHIDLRQQHYWPKHADCEQLMNDFQMQRRGWS